MAPAEDRRGVATWCGQGLPAALARDGAAGALRVAAHRARRADACAVRPWRARVRKADQAHLEALVHGVIEHANDLHAGIQPFLDRPCRVAEPDRARAAADRRLRADAVPRHSLPGRRSTKRWSSPRATAAPTGTSTSTACSTSSPPRSGRTRPGDEAKANDDRKGAKTQRIAKEAMCSGSLRFLCVFAPLR